MTTMTHIQHSSYRNRQTCLDWRALTFALLFPGKGCEIDPNLSMHPELENRAKQISTKIWSSLHGYMHRNLSSDVVTEAKSILREITAAALTFHLDMMKYTTELSFADDKGGKDRPEESLGSDLRGRVRLEVSPPLSKMTAFGDTTPNRQVLRPAQVYVTVLEQQSQTRVEKAIAPLYITESDVPKSNSNRRRSSDTRGNETRRRNG